LALFCESVMFEPATKVRVEAETVAAAPLDVPPATDPIPSQTGCAVCAGAEIVMEELLELKTMAPPATRLALEELPFKAKFVAAVETEIVMDLLLEENPMPAPATKLTLEELPFREKFVAAGTKPAIFVLASDDQTMLIEPAGATGAVLQKL